MIKKSLLKYINSFLPETILEVIPLSGGDINAVYRLKCKTASWVVKINDVYDLPQLFKNEEAGLGAIIGTNTIKTPQVIAQDSLENDAFIILEWVDNSVPNDKGWDNFGHQLAKLHSNTRQAYGFAENNFIASLKQSNADHTSWVDFYINERLNPQLQKAANDGLLFESVEQFEKLFKKLPDLIPEEKPALLHGDLWSGNVMFSDGETPYLIDPAVYYGQREMDVAMTFLFGGFNDRFISAYNNEKPLLAGWDERIPLMQLYPLLVHVNLFGSAYTGSIKSIINKFV